MLTLVKRMFPGHGHCTNHRSPLFFVHSSGWSKVVRQCSELQVRAHEREGNQQTVRSCRVYSPLTIPRIDTHRNPTTQTALYRASSGPLMVGPLVIVGPLCVAGEIEFFPPVFWLQLVPPSYFTSLTSTGYKRSSHNNVGLFLGETTHKCECVHTRVYTHTVQDATGTHACLCPSWQLVAHHE